ncbi:hypothetical protein [Desulforhabdus amnigena]|uniref:Uncharacterized protein n=1 Tax=Desulforhabdus amnigena TaxID=40218 RepID=A0A9W6D5K2_9BACT|nr:hypothetical protein [Desulforhabdus amnigena]NLJ27982.1 hypothetical protein [Deltaproteobacteria bacterium]GLI33731.1 hypothetical protein DAMNIGENAA_11640 [Desulforhabdus amnigena]
MADLKSMLEKIGDHIGQSQGYVELKGLDAVYRYLIDKYSWRPDEVRNLSLEDLKLLLAGYEEKATTDWI